MSGRGSQKTCLETMDFGHRGMWLCGELRMKYGIPGSTSVDSGIFFGEARCFLKRPEPPQKTHQTQSKQIIK